MLGHPACSAARFGQRAVERNHSVPTRLVSRTHGIKRVIVNRTGATGYHTPRPQLQIVPCHRRTDNSAMHAISTLQFTDVEPASSSHAVGQIHCKDAPLEG